MREPIATPRELARELARKYSTMTHEELDVLESVLVPMKFSKGEIILREGEVCRNIYYVERGLIRQFYFKNGKQITEKNEYSFEQWQYAKGQDNYVLVDEGTYTYGVTTAFTTESGVSYYVVVDGVESNIARG